MIGHVARVWVCGACLRNKLTGLLLGFDHIDVTST